MAAEPLRPRNARPELPIPSQSRVLHAEEQHGQLWPLKALQDGRPVEGTTRERGLRKAGRETIRSLGRTSESERDESWLS